VKICDGYIHNTCQKYNSSGLTSSWPLAACGGLSLLVGAAATAAPTRRDKPPSSLPECGYLRQFARGVVGAGFAAVAAKPAPTRIDEPQ